MAALPIWIAYMQRALKGTPAAELPMPAGIAVVQINPESGLRDDAILVERVLLQRISAAGRATTRWLPRHRGSPPQPGQPGTPAPPGRDIRDQIF